MIIQKPIEIKHQVVRLASKYLNGQPMYPGLWLCTYVKMFGSVWIMTDMRETL